MASFIETQFPVSKVSKESYKERKSGASQTLTPLGKWWGRKPLVLVRSIIIGCLMPASTDLQKDMDVFLKIMNMDSDALYRRKEKVVPSKRIEELITSVPQLNREFGGMLRSGKPLDVSTRISIDKASFYNMSYDEKLKYCICPDEYYCDIDKDWESINEHLHTNANSLEELIKELSQKTFKNNAPITVSDVFCGGGSIPFEARRMGCNTQASDLNPIAALLTWGAQNIIGSKENGPKVSAFCYSAFAHVQSKIDELGIERNELGERAQAYLMCNETKCPECDYMVPLLPYFTLSKKYKHRCYLRENAAHKNFFIDVALNCNDEEMLLAERGTVEKSTLICPHCGAKTPLSVIRHDIKGPNGKTVNSLREWERGDFVPRKDDIFQERLYAVRYEKENGYWYYRAPNARDMLNEQRVLDIVSENIEEWMKAGHVPDCRIIPGMKTTELYSSRGWAFWHQLFAPRQLLMLALLSREVKKSSDKVELAAGALMLNKVADVCSRLSMLHTSRDEGERTFYNQALNPLYNWYVRASSQCITAVRIFSITPNINRHNVNAQIELLDARTVNKDADLFITDPPYADAVNYHELTEFFLAWDKSIIRKAFPEWYTDSKRSLAVRGDSDFSSSMIEIYSNLTRHMPDNGMQVVMFTHNDPAVWAQLAIIMWKAGLRVTAAWNIATETDAGGLRNGNYVKATVILVLRKRLNSDVVFLDEIYADIQDSVEEQLASMQALDDKEEPNFCDPDYVLAAYAASLKVLTSYDHIEGMNLDAELDKAINDPAHSGVVKLINEARDLAYNCIIPKELDSQTWRFLTKAEKFYVKCLEAEKAGDYSVSTYQEYARGFDIAKYPALMASIKANKARLKTPEEMGTRTVSEMAEFESSLLRTVCGGISAGIKHDENLTEALKYIKAELGQRYWEKRNSILKFLTIIANTKDIENMRPHWGTSAAMAESLIAMVEHDSI